MKKMVEAYADHVVYVGRVFGSDVLLPSWFRHFGESKTGGTKEAMHIGIFGKTGSGKSVLGEMVMLSYMRHPNMSLLVLDPQGEFSKIEDDNEVRDFVKSLKKKVDAFNISDLVLLPDLDLFKKILIDSQFLKRLGIRADKNQWDAAYQIVKILRSKSQARIDVTGKIWPGQAHKRAVFDIVWEDLQKPEYLNHIYSTPAGRKRVQDTMEYADVKEFYSVWKSVARLFGRDGGDTQEISNLLDRIGNRDGSVTVINLSGTGAPTDPILE